MIMLVVILMMILVIILMKMIILMILIVIILQIPQCETSSQEFHTTLILNHLSTKILYKL